MSNIQSIAGSFAIVTKVTSGCCGEIVLPSGSEALYNGNVLTGEAIKSGAIKWFPEEHLKFKGRTARALDRLFQKHGFDMNGICLVPTSSLEDLQDEGNEIIARYFQDLDDLEQQYDSIVSTHASSQTSAVQDLIMQSKLPWADFRKRFHCYIPRPSIFNPMGVESEEAQNEVKSGLQDAALLDIVKNASQMRNAIIGREKVDARSIEPLKRLVEKCRSFGIINPAFKSIAEEFDKFSATLVPPLVADKVKNLSNYVTFLGSEDAIAAFIANRNSDNAAISIDDILGISNTPEIAIEVASPEVIVNSPTIATAETVDVIKESSVTTSEVVMSSPVVCEPVEQSSIQQTQVTTVSSPVTNFDFINENDWMSF